MKQFVTKQMKKWAGDFGRQYTDRNATSLQEMELIYKELYGLTRTEMNLGFLGDLDRQIKILEVGSNIGNQLLCLQEAGFENLYGIELQSYAVNIARSRVRGINIIQGSALNIPFKEGFFDLVFTSVVLIHIAPEHISRVLDEIYRCTKQYIWGFEYYADVHTKVPYRGQTELLWKANFSKLFLDRFADLRLVREEFFK
jgi:pseudaminic acid biosynthesis-associated methylase